MGYTSYLWDPVSDCVLQEYDGDENLTAEYTNEPSPFGPVLSQHRNGTTSDLLADALGSTRLIADDSGAVTDSFVYDAWGEELDHTGTTETPYRWVGQWGYQTDDELESVYVRARTYMPDIARWISIDPLWEISEYLLFAYSNNIPASFADPSGMLPYFHDFVECPPVVIPPPPNCTKPGMTCGPEVSHALLLTLIKAREKLSTYSYGGRTLARWRLETFLQGYKWDITGLVGLEQPDARMTNVCFDQRKGTKCDTCVQVFGVMHDVWEVNYSLFGLICYFIGWPESTCRQRVLHWKSFKFALGEPNPCRPDWQYTITLQQWLFAGYRFGRRFPATTLKSLAPKTGNPRFDECGICNESGIPPGQYFDFMLLEDIGGDDNGWP